MTSTASPGAAFKRPRDPSPSSPMAVAVPRRARPQPPPRPLMLLVQNVHIKLSDDTPNTDICMIQLLFPSLDLIYI